MNKICLILIFLMHISFPAYSVNNDGNNFTSSEISGQNDFPDIEKDVIRETNLARTNPKVYADKLRKFIELFDGTLIKIPGKTPLMTQEGVRAVNEAIVFLMKVEPADSLTESQGITRAARDHVNDQSANGTIGHYGSSRTTPFDRMRRYGVIEGGAAENITYGFDTAEMIVMSLIIDDGVPGRGHRTNIFRKIFRKTGVAFGTHPVYRHFCVIGYAAGFKEKQ